MSENMASFMQDLGKRKRKEGRTENQLLWKVAYLESAAVPI